jgi:hypothetical protein
LSKNEGESGKVILGSLPPAAGILSPAAEYLSIEEHIFKPAFFCIFTPPVAIF